MAENNEGIAADEGDASGGADALLHAAAIAACLENLGTGMVVRRAADNALLVANAIGLECAGANAALPGNQRKVAVSGTGAAGNGNAGGPFSEAVFECPATGSTIRLFSPVARRPIPDTERDPVTGVMTRGRLLGELTQILADTRHREERVGLIVVNVGGYAEIHDSLGTTATSELLRTIANGIVGTLRGDDLVGRVARDEFAAVVRYCSSLDDITGIVTRIRNAVPPKLAIGQQEMTFELVAGIAMSPEHTNDAEELLRMATAASMHAKLKGRDELPCFPAPRDRHKRQTIHIMADLHRALKEERLQLYYQPLVSCHSGTIVGFEALLRWNHPEYGLLLPSHFLAAMEEAGLMIEAGRWIIDRACHQLVTWSEAGFDALSIAVNLSGRQIASPAFVDEVRETIERHGIAARQLEFEIAESVLVEQADMVEIELRKLKQLGVKIVVDDFGTGYSNLTYLRRFPIDAIKIDRSFINDITRDPFNASITRAVIQLAHDLNLTVVAEGVETESQQAFLANDHCDLVQGFVLSHPLPEKDATDLLRTDRRFPIPSSDVTQRNRTLLVVDDEANILSTLRRLLRREGFRLLTASSGEEALEVLARNEVDVIISDHRMPQMTGVELLRRAKTLYPDTIRIVLSGYADLRSVMEAINEGSIYRFLAKPWDDDVLKANIDEAFRRKELADENRRLMHEIAVANVELNRVNNELKTLLDSKQRELELRKAAQETSRAVLEHVPFPILGVDPEGIVSFVNQAANVVFAQLGETLGGRLAQLLPDLPPLADFAAEESCRPVTVKGQRWRASCQLMLPNDPSRGYMISLQADAPTLVSAIEP